ncbi:MAG: hypothetical protein LBS93_04185 [Synergistaceae bacterium]|nr:hypothetical protein [Synergistaceae bacterium]
MRQSFKTKLKQLCFPAVFRLPEPEFSKEQLDLLEELIQLIQPTLSQAEKAVSDERMGMARFLVDLGTGIWRIRSKIEGLSRMPKEIRDALYSLESTWASMAEGGVEIVDHIGTVPSKDEARIVEIRDMPKLTRDQVVETVKPTITFRGEVIQIGEVVMGRPAAAVADAQDDAPQPHQADGIPDVAEETADSDDAAATLDQEEPPQDGAEEKSKKKRASKKTADEENEPDGGDEAPKKTRRIRKNDAAAEVEDIG